MAKKRQLVDVADARREAAAQIDRRDRYEAAREVLTALTNLRAALRRHAPRDPLMRPLRQRMAPVLHEIARLEYEDRAMPGEEIEAAHNRVMIERGASGDDVAGLANDGDVIRDSAERKAANRLAQRRLRDLEPELADLEAEKTEQLRRGFAPSDAFETHRARTAFKVRKLTRSSSKKRR